MLLVTYKGLLEDAISFPWICTQKHTLIPSLFLSLILFPFFLQSGFQSYDSLRDPHLAKYFKRPNVRSHLVRAGLVSEPMVRFTAFGSRKDILTRRKLVHKVTCYAYKVAILSLVTHLLVHHVCICPLLPFTFVCVFACVILFTLFYLQSPTQCGAIIFPLFLDKPIWPSNSKRYKEHLTAEKNAIASTTE